MDSDDPRLADFLRVRDQHYQPVFDTAMALSQDEELAQWLTDETFRNAYRSWKRIRTGLDVGEWLQGIVQNNYKNYRRRQNPEGESGGTS